MHLTIKNLISLLLGVRGGWRRPCIRGFASHLACYGCEVAPHRIIGSRSSSTIAPRVTSIRPVTSLGWSASHGSTHGSSHGATHGSSWHPLGRHALGGHPWHAWRGPLRHLTSVLWQGEVKMKEIKNTTRAADYSTMLSHTKAITTVISHGTLMHHKMSFVTSYTHKAKTAAGWINTERLQTQGWTQIRCRFPVIFRYFYICVSYFPGSIKWFAEAILAISSRRCFRWRSIFSLTKNTRVQANMDPPNDVWFSFFQVNYQITFQLFNLEEFNWPSGRFVKSRVAKINCFFPTCSKSRKSEFTSIS